MKIKLLVSITIFSFVQLFAITSQDIENTQLQKAKEKEKAILDAQPIAPTVKLQDANLTTKKLIISKSETPCFEIKSVDLSGENATIFKSSLSSALSNIGFKPNECLGTNSIKAILNATGNEIIKHGYVTTRVVAIVDLLIGFKPGDVIPDSVIKKIDDKIEKNVDLSLFRGGNKVTVRVDTDIEINNGFVNTLNKKGKPQGLSVNINPHDINIQNYGGAFPVNSLPDGLVAIQSGKAGHYVIAPAKPMTLDSYQQLLNKIDLGKFNKLP